MTEKLGIYVCSFCGLPVKVDQRERAKPHQLATKIVGLASPRRVDCEEGEGKKAIFMPLIERKKPDEAFDTV